MSRPYQRLPFKIGTTSMVFGSNLLENTRILAGLVDHIEILLFHTPSLHNIPGPQEIRILKRIGEQEKLTFTVHLPASLEIASPEKKKREESVQMVTEFCLKTAELVPIHYILHIPYTPPTLVPVPGLYFTQGRLQDWDEWTLRALESLEMIHEGTGRNNKLLVENINYSPYFLEPIWKRGYCELCLDLGHLMLGQENVMDAIRTNLSVTKEIHLHGVKGYDEHLSLSIMPKKRVHEWLGYLKKTHFQGVMILEVFSPQDLKESMDILLETP